MGETNTIDNVQLHRRLPWGKWQIVDVKFPSGANTDYVIGHDLGPTDPQDVHYTVLKQTTAGTIYQSFAGSAKPWTTSYIVLRSDTSNWKGRILLTLLKNPMTFNPMEIN